MADRIDPTANQDTDAELLRLFRALTPNQRQRLMVDWQARIGRRATGV